MPIYAPGHRDGRGRTSHGAAKNKVVYLSLTAMVDMFTVLVVFLLQNYSSTGEVLYIPKEVKLPQARAVKELTPAHVVTISNDAVLLDKDALVAFDDVKAQKDWLIRELYDSMKATIEKDQKDYEAGTYKPRRKVKEGEEEEKGYVPEYRRVTVQADQEIDFATIRKVMYTVTQAGAFEINFAVIKRKDGESATE